jgi:VWFA-related protein
MGTGLENRLDPNMYGRFRTSTLDRDPGLKGIMNPALRTLKSVSTYFAVALAVANVGFSTARAATIHQIDGTGAVTQAAQPSDAAPIQGHRITIDVVAEDKLSHPTRGLQASDFTVLDNNQSQNLVGFRAMDGNGTTPDPVHILIVVDMINCDFTTVAREREQLGEYLNQDSGRLGHPTGLAVLTESGLKMMTGSTLDGKALMTNFQKVQTEIRSVGRAAGFYGAAERLEMSLAQLSQLAAYEGTQPGRKMVLVISPGWPLLSWAGTEEDTKQRAWVFNSIVHLSNGLREAHVALYCLDPFELGRTNPFYYQNYLKPVANIGHAEYPDLALQVLAEHSGGRGLTTGRDILGEIDTALHDAGSYYELTFEAPTADHPNEYHGLRVKTDKPDLKILTTAGYYAETQALAPASGSIKK